MDDNLSLTDQVSLIREVFAYTRRFRRSTFVIKIDCSIIDEPGFPVLARDISLLKGNGIRIIIIPGARERIDQILNTYNISCDEVNGIRVTPPEAIPFIKMAAFDTANKVMTALSAFGENAVIGNWVKARAYGVIDGRDFLNSGKVEKINSQMLEKLLDEDLIPIIPSIGWNSTGLPYNIGSDDLALATALQMQAGKLFYIGKSDILYSPPYNVAPGTGVAADGRISKMNAKAARDFLEANRELPGRHVLDCSIQACENGIDRVHILDGKIEGVILKEIYSSLGSGTMIYTNIYESIRPMEEEDVTAILTLMAPLIEKGLLINRTREDILNKKEHYAVYSIDNMIHGCAALIPFGKDHGEIAGIAVDPLYNHLGIGKRLVSYFVEQAREKGMRSVFVLTTEAVDWFLAHGFSTATLEDLPAEKQKSYNNRRNSRILMMDTGI